MAKGNLLATGVTVATIVSSDKTTTGVFTANLKTLTTSTATGRAIPMGDAVTMFLNVTALTTDASPNLRVFLQHSFDGGTTWITAEQFAAVTSSTDVQTINFRQSGLGWNEAATRNSTTTGTNASLAQNCVIGPDQRIGWVLAGTGVTSASFTVGALVQPIGTAGA